MLVDLIALVKSPATTIPFAVIKSMEGGDESVDEILKLVQEICPADKFEGVEKADIPEESIEAVKTALTALKGTISDLPESLQTAIRALVKIAGYGHAPQKKSATTSDEGKSELLTMLEGIQAQVVNSDKKFDTVMEETKKSKEDIQKSLTDLTSRLTQLETATGTEKAKAAEETQNIEKSKDEEIDVWAGTIPNIVMEMPEQAVI